MDHERRFTLAELTAAAGVSVRTVRFYVSEGLLPPPNAAGPHTTYTREHLDRLLAIGQMKRAYLPLREIRRRLTGLDAAAIRHLTEEEREPVSPPVLHSAFMTPVSPPLNAISGRAVHDSAASYLGRVLGGPITTSPALPPPDQTWRRLPIGESAELLITEDVYRRNGDKIDWLIDWAKKVIE